MLRTDIILARLAIQIDVLLHAIGQHARVAPAALCKIFCSKCVIKESANVSVLTTKWALNNVT